MKAIHSSWRRLGTATGLLLIALMMCLTLAACGANGSIRTLGAAQVTPTNAAGTPAASSQTQQPQKLAQSSPQAVSGQSSDQVESNSVVGVVNKANPAVVTVYNKVKYSSIAGQVGGNGRGGNATPTPSTSSANGNDYVVQGIGSGIIISQDGYIVTNNHVVDGQENLTVALNDGKVAVPAKLIGQDTLGDIAVLKIDGPVPGYLQWADQSQVQVGETVIAIGSALGDFRNSVSKGVISGLNRTLEGDSNIYIQTDAAINHGNSGGPLLDLQGNVVGINTAVLRSTGEANSAGTADVAEGLGFAIPSYYAKLIAEQLISNGKVTRPFFGISYQMITPADAGSLTANGDTVPAVEGAWVMQGTANQPGVVVGGPADKAGLKVNDVITAIDGEALNDNNPLLAVILKHKPGDVVQLTVQRGDQTVNITLTLGERPAGQ